MQAVKGRAPGECNWLGDCRMGVPVRLRGTGGLDQGLRTSTGEGIRELANASR